MVEDVNEPSCVIITFHYSYLIVFTRCTKEKLYGKNNPHLQKQLGNFEMKNMLFLTFFAMIFFKEME